MLVILYVNHEGALVHGAGKYSCNLFVMDRHGLNHYDGIRDCIGLHLR